MTPANRRCFVKWAAASGVAASSGLVARAKEQAAEHPVAVFAKHVQTLEFGELGRRLKSIGVQGIEATLRKGGQIEPAQLSQQLGRLCDALAKHDQRVVIAASDVNQVDAPSEAYLKTLAQHDVRYFRMAYYRYDFNRPMLPQLDGFAQQAQQLAQLCQSLGLTALYQNHAGKNYVGAALWDLREVIADIAPAQLAVALDIRHTALELSNSYHAAYKAMRAHMGATYIKDFDWIEGRATNVPLGTGRAKPLFDLIHSDGLIGPLSLHMEYIDHRDPAEVENRWKAISQDVATLQTWLA